jgi:hypothetical protein
MDVLAQMSDSDGGAWMRGAVNLTDSSASGSSTSPSAISR